MPKNVQIPFELFLQLVRCHLLNDTDDNLSAAIKKSLEDKLEALIRHDLYSTYKNKTLSPEEQEQARQQYLDRVGMRESFRWSSGSNPHNSL